MKKIIVLLLILTFAQNNFAQNNFTQTADTNVLSKRINVLSKTLDIQKIKTDSLAYVTRLIKVKTNYYDVSRKISFRQGIIICMPVFFFIVISLLVMLRLKNERFKLKRALSDDPAIDNFPNPAFDPANPLKAPATIKVVYFKPSASRLIAFLSGMAAISIAVSSTTYFSYMYFRTGVEPNLDKLYDILLALGIGVTPYAVGKVSNAISK